MQKYNQIVKGLDLISNLIYYKKNMLKTIYDVPDQVKIMPEGAQKIWLTAFNDADKKYKNEKDVFDIADIAVNTKYRKVDDKWVQKMTSYRFPIQLSETKIKKRMQIHVIPVGEWKHSIYGDMKITKEDITDFCENFKKKVRKGVQITEGHDVFSETPAVGWFVELIDKGKKGLWAMVEWTEKGRELLNDKAYKYFSPEFYSVYEDPETHRLYNNVLVGGALTNSPYFKGLKAIVMTESLILDQFNEEKIMLKKEKIKNLSEEEKKEKEEEKEEEEKEKKTEESTEEKTEEEEEKEEEEEEEEEEKEEEEEEEETELSEKKESVVYRAKKVDLSEKVVYQIKSPGVISLKEKKGKTDLSSFKKEILREGSWKHGATKSGVLEITQDTFKNIIKNFKDKVLDNVFVPLGHPSSDDPSKNVGEVIDLTIEGEKLMAEIEVKDESVVQKIKKGLIKCISASISENYITKDKQKDVGATLFHAALVSEPYIKGMEGFVPLSEEMKGSTIVSLVNAEEPEKLEDVVMKLSEGFGKMEKVISQIAKSLKLSESTSEEEETEEESKEEEETKSVEVSEGTEKAEEEKTETEETETEETTEEAEEVKEEVALAEAEKTFDELLRKGKVTPAEKSLLMPLLVSKTSIELSDGKKVESSKQLIEYLENQSSKIPLSEEGTTQTDEKKKKKNEVKMSAEVSRNLDKLGEAFNLSEDEKEDIAKEVEGDKEEK